MAASVSARRSSSCLRISPADAGAAAEAPGMTDDGMMDE